MSSVEHHIDISFRARYFSWGNLSEETATIWFVLHGYGQLAQYFIKKFESLDPEKNFVIAPEGLSRFYLQGFDGRVGATWMTRENRLTDIYNYIGFLDKLYQSLNLHSRREIKILGFSQGAATASRWVSTGNIPFHHLVLWAGIFPPDLKTENSHFTLQGKRITIVTGTNDPYITQERITEMKEISSQLRVEPELMSYEGDHSIHLPTLKKLVTPALQ